MLTYNNPIVLVAPKFTNMKTLSVKMEKELAEMISLKAKEEDRSESSVIRQALRAFLFNNLVAPKFTKTSRTKKAQAK